MTYEFEGRTEKEAIDGAAEKLGLEKDAFEVEILETQRQGLFKKGFVRIRVHVEGLAAVAAAEESSPKARRAPAFANAEERRDFEEEVREFVSQVIAKMGYAGQVSILFREESKLGLKIDSDHSAILIGKKGKNIDALQLLANVYARQKGHDDMRIVLDSENYRIRREESLVRLAYAMADRVGETRSSVLLEPMNPFDRRLIHTTLNDIAHVETKSEGDGLYKRVRVSFLGAGAKRHSAQGAGTR
ncbi:MAG: protein jag [Treponema sp.]|nr:protein jag [Treponema sp.]